MQLGMLLRNSGPPSNADFIADCARAADTSGLDHVWVLDHIAIPPEESEGSGGRYVDALATLAFVAGITARIGIGTSVLVVPYRPALAIELAGGDSGTLERAPECRRWSRLDGDRICGGRCGT